MHYINNMTSAYKKFSSSEKQSGNDFFFKVYMGLCYLLLPHCPYTNNNGKNMARHLICPGYKVRNNYSSYYGQGNWIITDHMPIVFNALQKKKKRERAKAEGREERKKNVVFLF